MNITEHENSNESYNYYDSESKEKEEDEHLNNLNVRSNKSPKKKSIIFQNTKKIDHNEHETPCNWKFISEALQTQSKNKNKLHESLLIYAVTWNLKGLKPSKEELKFLLPKNKKKEYHFYIIATQECMRSILSSFFYSNKDDWIDMIKEELGDTYTLLKSDSLSSLHLAVFAYNSIDKEATNLASTSIKTGMGNMVGNKGAVGISLEIRGKSFLFLNSHLAAGHKSSEKRNKDFNRINTNISIGNIKPLEGEAITDLFDFCIWLGDFNYRVDYDTNKALELIYNEEAYKLQEFDQMSVEIRNNNLRINNFIEGLISFNPTYKYYTGIKNKDNYDVNYRVPGWTDRVLYKSRDDNLILCKYESMSDTYTSDHKPVYAIFRVDFFSEKETEPELEVINKANTTNKSQLCMIF